MDLYEEGKVVGHEGVWLSGQDGARFGLMIPGDPQVGARFYQEHAPGEAMDRAEIISLNERITVPAGSFENCLHLKEYNPLDGGMDDKWFAPGIGIIQDEDLVLTGIKR